MTDEGLYFPNDILLKDVIIKVGTKLIDVKRMLLQLNLFEDLYSNALTGSITLVDAVNLIGNAPFVGQEELLLTYKTPGFEGGEEVHLEFDIYQIADRNTGVSSDLTDITQNYTLHFVSKSYYKNLQTKVRQAFKNQRIEEMVRAIGQQIGIKDISAEPTSGKYTFVIPGWTPFYTINWLASRARPEKNPYAVNYFFFETINGFQFVSLNDLIQRPVQMRYVYAPANLRFHHSSEAGASRGLVFPEFMGVRNFTILKSGTTLERIEQGMYASKLITHDLVRKQFSSFDFRYKEDFLRTQHLEDFNVDGKGVRIKQTPKAFPGISRHSDQTETLVKFYPKHSFLFDDLKDYDDSQKWVLPRNSQLRQIEQLRLRVELPGDANRRVGDVVIFEAPRPELVKGYNASESKDPNISGNYIITSIHHIIELDSHRMVIELSKESLPAKSKESIVDALDIASTLNSASRAVSNAFSSGKTLLRNIFK